ncbi:hypothetical protein DL98DRAFT_85494 [Cadophora sp. DSE1049]|nr:hypothetical protein DL98DRAFT_85494 [Cadophora sp. DSE1049]
MSSPSPSPSQPKSTSRPQRTITLNPTAALIYTYFFLVHSSFSCMFASQAWTRISEDGDLVDWEWWFVGCASAVFAVFSFVAYFGWSLLIEKSIATREYEDRKERGKGKGKGGECVCVCACGRSGEGRWSGVGDGMSREEDGLKSA